MNHGLTRDHVSLVGENRYCHVDVLATSCVEYVFRRRLQPATLERDTQSRGQSVRKTEWKEQTDRQTDRRKDATDYSTFPANAAGNS